MKNEKELLEKKAELEKISAEADRNLQEVKNEIYTKIDIPKVKALLGQCFVARQRRQYPSIFKVTGNDGGIPTGIRIWRDSKIVKKKDASYDNTRINRYDFVHLEHLEREWEEITNKEFNRRYKEMVQL